MGLSGESLSLIWTLLDDSEKIKYMVFGELPNFKDGIPKKLDKDLENFKNNKSLSDTEYHLKNLYQKYNSFNDSYQKELVKLQSDFNNRVLKVENYLLDQETQRNLPTLTLFKTSFISFNNKYTLPCVDFSNIHIASITLNNINNNLKPISFIIKTETQNYLYSNYRCALEYFFPNDFYKFKNKNIRKDYAYIPLNITKPTDIFGHQYDKIYTLYFTENDKTYRYVINANKQTFLESFFIDIKNTDVIEITKEQSLFEITTYKLSQSILNNLPQLKYKQKKQHKIGKYIVTFTNFMTDDGDINSSLKIHYNEKEIFSGNYYSRYISLGNTGESVELLQEIEKLLK